MFEVVNFSNLFTNTEHSNIKSKVHLKKKENFVMMN